MSCHPSFIPSLDWGHLLIKVAPLFSPRQQSQSTTPMAIPFSQAGMMRLDRTSGTSLSPQKPHWMHQRTHHLSRPSRHHYHVPRQQTWYCSRGNRNMLLFPRGNRNRHVILLSSIADIHPPAGESPLSWHPITSTRIARSGGVDTHSMSAQHIASTDSQPTRQLQ